MAIQTRLLNSSVAFVRHGATKSNDGDFGGANTTLATGVPCRILKNENFGRDGLEDAGPINVSEYLAIIEGIDDNITSGTVANLQTGDYLVDGSDIYYMNDVDKSPGGIKSGHQIYHWELYLSITKGAN